MPQFLLFLVHKVALFWEVYSNIIYILIYLERRLEESGEFRTFNVINIDNDWVKMRIIWTSTLSGCRKNLKKTNNTFLTILRHLLFKLNFCNFEKRFSWFLFIHAQSVILHMFPLNYVIKIVIILCQNLSILNAPVAKFLNELNRNLLTAILAVHCLWQRIQFQWLGSTEHEFGEIYNGTLLFVKLYCLLFDYSDNNYIISAYRFILIWCSLPPWIDNKRLPKSI